MIIDVLNAVSVLCLFVVSNTIATVKDLFYKTLDYSIQVFFSLVHFFLIPFYFGWNLARNLYERLVDCVLQITTAVLAGAIGLFLIVLHPILGSLIAPIRV